MSDVQAINCPWCNCYMRCDRFPKHMHECDKNPRVLLLARLVRAWLDNSPNTVKIPQEIWDLFISLKNIAIEALHDPSTSRSKCCTMPYLSVGC